MSGQLPSCARGLLSRWHTNTLCTPQASVQRSGSAARSHKAPPPHAAWSHKACSVPTDTLDITLGPRLLQGHAHVSRDASSSHRGEEFAGIGSLETADPGTPAWWEGVQGAERRYSCWEARVQSFGFWGMLIFSSSHARERTVAATHMPMFVIFVECSGGRLVSIARPPRKGGPTRSACVTHTLTAWKRREK
jgi:hypothetical protein